MQWIKIGDAQYLNASSIKAVMYDKNAGVYKLTTHEGALLADRFEPVSTFDIKDEKEN